MQAKVLECAGAKQGEAKPKDTTDQGCEEDKDTKFAQLIEIDRVLPMVGVTCYSFRHLERSRRRF